MRVCVCVYACMCVCVCMCVLGLGQILKFTFEYLLIKCSSIRSFGVSFQVTSFLAFMHALLSFIFLNLFNKFVSIWKVQSNSTE